MTTEQRHPVETPCAMPRRGFVTATRTMRAAKVLITSAGAAAVVVTAAPAHADPTGPSPDPGVTNSTDATFIQALDHIGVERPSDANAILVAKDACDYIRQGHSIWEGVSGVKNTYPNVTIIQAGQFVAIARQLYCIDTVHNNARGVDDHW